MPGLTDAGENTVLDSLYNGTATTYTGLPTADIFVSLHSADPGDTGANELTGGGYARQQTAFGASASGTLSNTGTITWSVPAGDVVAWGAWSASSGGTCYQTGWVSTVANLALIRDADLTADDVQSHEHGFAANDRVVFEQIEQLTAPTGMTLGTLYWVIATGLTTDAFRFSATQGGAAVNMTASGVAVVRKVVVTNFSSAGTAQIAAGDLDIFATE